MLLIELAHGYTVSLASSLPALLSGTMREHERGAGVLAHLLPALRWLRSDTSEQYDMIGRTESKGHQSLLER